MTILFLSFFSYLDFFFFLEMLFLPVCDLPDAPIRHLMGGRVPVKLGTI